MEQHQPKKKRKYDKYGNLLEPFQHVSDRDRAIQDKYNNLKAQNKIDDTKRFQIQTKKGMDKLS